MVGFKDYAFFIALPKFFRIYDSCVQSKSTLKMTVTEEYFYQEERFRLLQLFVF
jgi:hypothetical protein